MVTTLEKKPGLVQVLSEWILLTYDIPAKEGKKRARFLRRVREVGAQPFSESCYLLPSTPEMYAIAEELAAVGEAYVWVSEMKDPVKALKITNTFQAALQQRIQGIQTRIGVIQLHLQAGRVLLAYRMALKTVAMLEKLEKLALASEYPDILPLIEKAGEAMKAMLEKKEE